MDFNTTVLAETQSVQTLLCSQTNPQMFILNQSEDQKVSQETKYVRMDLGEVVSLTGNQLFSLGHYGAAESTMKVVLSS